ncbi:MAG: 1-deoxy-D-xylulose 5-phosphate synthase [Candidatus Ozemobacter sibiricus]|jgi:1-deoxy-D-xylulose-5-phosphate synthase|uniref:1-deoxy-D-xylulose-5-phosphate synthase n=1 Tax=Candidatus Ozemobacter sibiricus TaxID=2268124 RepID=A0A367ZPV4_9BACT|nr:MAG: 1-deoxy-D-xylulose 5-phosphate synthase [Candidatus Ozemobacter sibiricus]
MPILDKIRSPADLKGLSRRELVELSQEMRERIIHVVSRNGGHLASNLGIVELTLAIHRVFDSPRDRIIFDVGHQCYVHKMVTGRQEQFPTLRTLGGISGFPKSSESEHDAFDTGHSSTSISAALGLALARDHFAQTHKIVAVIGDGAMTGGLAFEALNHAGHRGSDLVVILNDNEMSISPNVGAMSHYLHKLRLEPAFFNRKEYLEYVVKQIPGIGSRLFNILLRLEGTLKYLLTPGMLFEEFGFKYLGPISGYDFDLMERTLAHARDRKGPVLVHVLTEKGRGYRPAKEQLPLFHGVGPFEISTGKVKKEAEPPSYTAVFGQTIVEVAQADPRVVAITAAMKEGTGLDAFAAAFPNRFHDVGIAESHAVTLAAGMAKGGLRPVVAIYSTFLQRAYDQIVHDVALPNLPVMFFLDRAGLVGEDGPTHHGMFDLSYLRAIPNLVVMAPRDEIELRAMVRFAHALERPVAVRYPRGAGVGVAHDSPLQPLVVGRGEVLMEGQDLSLWACGNMVHPAWQAARQLVAHGLRPQVINARFVKPFDKALLERVLRRNMPIVTLEEGALAGGFGSALLETASDLGFTPRVLRIGLPDSFVPQGKPAELRAILGLDADSLVSRITAWLPQRQPVLRKVAI